MSPQIIGLLVFVFGFPLLLSIGTLLDQRRDRAEHARRLRDDRTY